MRTVLLALLALLLTASTASAQDSAPLPAPPGSEAEPNQTPETASPIEAGERIRAQRTVDDVDLYRFTAEAGDRVFAAVITLASPLGDSRLALLDSDGQTVLETDNDNGTLGAASSSIGGATIPAAGTYYLRVDATGDVELLPYDVLLDVQAGDPAAEVEPNGQARQPLEGDRFVSGTTAVDDQDLFGLELGAGDTVFLSLDLDPERDGQTFNGRVAFGNETVLVANDIGNSDAIPSEAYVGTVAVDGVYNLLVDAASGSGTYQLSITVIRAVERGCRTYTITPSPGAIADRAATTFPIEVPDAGTIDHVAVRLDLNHSFMSDLDATLEAPAGNLATLFDDIGSTTAGGSTRMLTLFDDNAGTPPAYTWLKGFGLQPERSALSYFAGQPAEGTWQLTLRDDAPDDAGELARADLILCTRPEEGPAETVFSAGFESGEDGFTHSGTADEWEQGRPATAAGGHLAGLTSCADGTGCFKTDLDGTYEPNSSQDLVSPPISLAGRTGEIYASWEMWYQLEGARFEHFAVTVEEDGGANARPLFTWGGNDMVASIGNPLVQLGLAAGWGRHRADISDYAGKTIRLRFHLDSDLNVQRRGVAIDDVRVYEALQPAAQTPVTTVEPPPVATAASPAPTAAVAPAAEPAISDLYLESRCVRRSAQGRVRVAMIMRVAQPGPVRVRIDRAVGSRARSSCPRANPQRNQRYRRVATFRRVTRVRAQAAAVKRRVALDLRLRPGLYRLSVRVGGSPPVRRFMRVVG